MFFNDFFQFEVVMMWRVSFQRLLSCMMYDRSYLRKRNYRIQAALCHLTFCGKKYNIHYSVMGENYRGFQNFRPFLNIREKILIFLRLWLSKVDRAFNVRSLHEMIPCIECKCFIRLTFINCITFNLTQIWFFSISNSIGMVYIDIMAYFTI